MPPKIRDLERLLSQAGYEKFPGKGSHRKWKHPAGGPGVNMSGQPGEDAKPYQEREVMEKIAESKSGGRK